MCFVTALQFLTKWCSWFTKIYFFPCVLHFGLLLGTTLNVCFLNIIYYFSRHIEMHLVVASGKGKSYLLLTRKLFVTATLVVLDLKSGVSLCWVNEPFLVLFLALPSTLF